MELVATVKVKYVKLRKQLQARGTKSAKRKLKDIKGILSKCHRNFK